MKFTLVTIFLITIKAQGLTPEQSALVADNAPNDFVCIDDTDFIQVTSPGNGVVSSCPPGFCTERNSPNKNPCIGDERRDAVDGPLQKRFVVRSR